MGCCFQPRATEPFEWYDAVWRIGIDLFYIFSIMKVLVWAISTMYFQTGNEKKVTTSPPIKPTNYQNQDLYLRECLVTMHWKLIANKARALYYMKMCSLRRRICTVSPEVRVISDNLPVKLLRTSEIRSDLTIRRRRSLGDDDYKNFP